MNRPIVGDLPIEAETFSSVAFDEDVEGHRCLRSSVKNVTKKKPSHVKKKKKKKKNKKKKNVVGCHSHAAFADTWDVEVLIRQR
ncbi:hypothetical protein BHE74_00051316 [Ensete ventricosum]|nr:hypothetical protein BHE74_00051316 [Ensete ventricosum]